jgi:hypothetical protein
MYGANTTSVQQRNLQAERDFINANRILLGLQPLDAPPLSASIPGSSATADIADQLRQDMNATTQTQPVPSPGVRQQVDSQQLDEQLGLAESRLRATAIAAGRLCNHAK